MVPSMKPLKLGLMFYSAVVVISAGGQVLKGHMKPWGEHRAPEGPIQSVDGLKITPEEFWQYHRRQEAVVLKNVTNAWPAFTRWSDSLLQASPGWGDFKVRTEGKVEGTAVPTTMPMRQFFNDFQDSKYVVSELPSPMYPDVNLPGCFGCGPFSSHVTEVDIWISNGATRSKFHKDSNNQLNCLLKGRKQWRVIDPTHIRKVPMLWEDDDPATKTAGESLVDITAVNLKHFPDLVEVPYNQSWLEPGDCIWMPGATLHNVISQANEEGRNLQVSFLMSEVSSVRKGIDPGYVMPAEFDPEGGAKSCKKGWAPRKLSEAYVAWPYPGEGGTTYGFDCPKKFKQRLAAIFEWNFGSNTVVDFDKFSQLYRALLNQDFPPGKPSEKLWVYEGHEKYIPDALDIMRRRPLNLGTAADWAKRTRKVGQKTFYPGLKEEAIDLAVSALKMWWDESPMTKDGLSHDELLALNVKEFQEGWAFLYFPVQSIGHAFMGAMERDDVRMAEGEEMRGGGGANQASEENHGECSMHSDCTQAGFFCSGTRRCEPDGECHFHHDAIDKKCPRGAKQEKEL